MTLPLTTTNQGTFAGATTYREGCPAAGLGSSWNPTPHTVQADKDAAVRFVNFGGLKGKLLAPVQRLGKSCLAWARDSAPWYKRQALLIAFIVHQAACLLCYTWQTAQRREQATQRREQAAQWRDKQADKIHAQYQTVHEQQLDLQLEELREQVAKQKHGDLDDQGAPTRYSSPLF